MPLAFHNEDTGLLPKIAVPSMIAMLLLAADSPVDTIFHFFYKGGWAMIPLAICSLVAVTIALLRGFALRRETVLPAVVEQEIERFQPGGNPEQLARLVGDDPAALSCLTRTAISHLRVSRAENTEAVQTRARREIMRLESGLAVLELIVGISPLLGLLGAIAGLVNVFSNLGANKVAADTAGVALGIAEALNTTIFGLAIAIPTLIAYTYFARKVEGMAVEMESLMADLLSKCYFRKGVRPAGYEDTEAPIDLAQSASYVPQARRLGQSPVAQAGDIEPT